MSRELVERPTTMRVAIHLCDRCGAEIPTGRVRGTEEGLLEGAGLSARGGGKWQPLIPVEGVESLTHSPEYHAANVDICERCLGSLREWFLSGEETERARP